MNIGRTIRVLHAEPVGDPRPGDWPAVPTAARGEVTAAGPDGPVGPAGAGAGRTADPDAATVDAAAPRV